MAGLRRRRLSALLFGWQLLLWSGAISASTAAEPAPDLPLSVAPAPDDETPPPPPTLKINTEALPNFVYTDDSVALTVSVEQVFGKNAPRRAALRVSAAAPSADAQVLLAIAEAAIPAHDRGAYRLRIPLDFSTFDFTTIDRLNLELQVSAVAEDTAENAEAPAATGAVAAPPPEIYRLAIVCNPVARMGEVGSKVRVMATPEGTPFALIPGDAPSGLNRGQFHLQGVAAVCAQPRFDETATRRWQVLAEIFRVQNWFRSPRVLLITENYADFFTAQLAAKLPQPEIIRADDLLSLYLAVRQNPGVTFARSATGKNSALGGFYPATESATSSRPEFPGADLLPPHYDTALIDLGVSELAAALPVEIFALRLEALLTLVQQNSGKRRIFIAGPPPYPARVNLREQYRQALAEICARRNCRYIDYAPTGEDFITATAPPESLQHYATTVAAAMTYGPAPLALLALPFLCLMAGLWWLRIFSRYAPKAAAPHSATGKNPPPAPAAAAS